jgi:tetratricopeptide (TPR) repeat protein
MSTATATHDLQQQPVDAQHPWPGLSPFTEDLHQYFRGRDREVDDLFRCVRRRILTVFFGQSGLGKTSLLQAGLFPRLRRQGFLPVPIRLDYAAGAPELAAQVKAAIAGAVETVSLAGAIRTEPAETLWEYFHLADARLDDRDSKPIRLVLVFDQFEELFTLGSAAPESRSRAALFHEELADLIENRAPAALELRFEEDTDLVERFIFDRQDHRVLLCLREDYFPHLEELRRRMPSITENRMRLTPMNGVQAFEAVTWAGDGLVSPAVGREIVRFVAGSRDRKAASGRGRAEEEVLEGLQIEPSLLSLVCQELNNRRLQQRLPEITADLLAGSNARILQDFYAKSLADQVPAVRAFVEDELLTESGFRVDVDLERARRLLVQRGAPPSAIDELVKRRLLHLEERLQIQRVELAHDVLAPIIQKSRDERQKADAIRQAEEREQEVRKKLRRLAAVAVVMGFIVAVISSLGVLSYLQWQEAKRQQQRASKNLKLLINFFKASDPTNILDGPAVFIGNMLERAARTIEEDFKDQPAEQARLMDQVGSVYRSLGAYAEAERMLKGALKIRQEAGLEIRQEADLDVATSLHSLAWLLHDQGDYDKAESNYQLALKIREAQGDEAAAATTKFQLAWLYTEKDEYDRAEDLFRNVIETRRSLGSGEQDVLVSHAGLAALYYNRGQYYQAWHEFENAKKVLGSQRGAEDVIRCFGLVMHARAHPKEAADDYRKCLDITRGVLGNKHRFVALILNELARTLEAAGKRDEAERCFEECLGILRKTVGIAHPRAIIPVRYLANLLAQKSQREQGEDLYGELLAARRERFGSLHPLVAEALLEWGIYLAPEARNWNKYRARLLLEQSNAILLRAPGSSARFPIQVHLYWNEDTEVPAHIYHTAFSPDGLLYLAGGDDGTARVYDVTTGECVQELERQGGWVESAAFTPDGKNILTASTKGTIRLWPITITKVSLAAVGASTVGCGAMTPRTETWSAVATLIAGSLKAVREFRRIGSLASPVHSVAITRDGKLALSCSEDGVIHLWDIMTARPAGERKGPPGVCYGTFSADGKQILSCHQDGSVWLWSVAEPRAKRHFEGHKGAVWGGFFLPEGNHILTYGEDRTLRVWDLARAKKVRELPLGDDAADIRSVAVSPGGKSFLSAHGDGTLRIREMATGREIQNRLALRYALPNYSPQPRGVSISPDGRYAACGSFRGLVYLFRLP